MQRSEALIFLIKKKNGKKKKKTVVKIRKQEGAGEGIKQAYSNSVRDYRGNNKDKGEKEFKANQRTLKGC